MLEESASNTVDVRRLDLDHVRRRRVVVPIDAGERPLEALAIPPEPARLAVMHDRQGLHESRDEVIGHQAARRFLALRFGVAAIC